MAMDRTEARDLLQEFKFEQLLIEIGWESVPPAPPRDIGDTGYQYRLISQTVFEVFPLDAGADGLPNAGMRAEIHKHIEKISFENSDNLPRQRPDPHTERLVLGQTGGQQESARDRTNTG